MIHHHGSFYIEPGLGDFIWHLSLVDSYGKSCVLGGPAWYKGYGLENLVASITPNVMNVKFDGLGLKWWWDYMYGGHDWKSCACTYMANRLGIRPQVVLSEEAVSRLGRYPRRDRLIVHPVPGGACKEWNGWGDLDLSGYDAICVGADKERQVLDLPRFSGDYLSLARFLVASRGVVCVSSSVYSLARLLGVPTVLICMDEISYSCYSGFGINLMRPTSSEVQFAIERMMEEGRTWTNGR